MEVDDISFLDHCGALGNGFVADAIVPLFIEKVLECGEYIDAPTRLKKLDELLPLDKDNQPHALYWICLMWLEGMGLIERRDCVGGLSDFYMTESGVIVLNSLRERKAAFS